MSNSDIIAISSAIIALLAMCATFWQGYVARKHSRLSVRPHLDGYVQSYPAKPLYIEIKNVGLGPAIIESFSISFDSATYELTNTSLPKFISEEFKRHPFPIEWVILGHDTPLGAGQTIRLLQFTPPLNDQELCKKAVQLLHRFQFTIKYKCFYGTCFEVHSGLPESLA